MNRNRIGLMAVCSGCVLLAGAVVGCGKKEEVAPPVQNAPLPVAAPAGGTLNPVTSSNTDRVIAAEQEAAMQKESAPAAPGAPQ